MRVIKRGVLNMQVLKPSFVPVGLSENREWMLLLKPSCTLTRLSAFISWLTGPSQLGKGFIQP